MTATEGPNSPGTMADDNAVGTETWSKGRPYKITITYTEAIPNAGQDGPYVY